MKKRLTILCAALIGSHLFPAAAAGYDLNLSDAALVPGANGSMTVLDFISGGQHYMGGATWDAASNRWVMGPATNLGVYHPNYVQVGGNGIAPTVEDSMSVTVWVEANSPFGTGGTAWFDGLDLRRKDGIGGNLLPATANWVGFDHEGGEMCRPAIHGQYCGGTSITRATDPGVWAFDPAVHLPDSARSLRVAIPASGKHSDAWPLVKTTGGVICLNGIPAGVELQASAFVKTAGNIQVRIGMDMRRHADAYNCPIGALNWPGSILSTKVVNGRILRAPREWTQLRLR